MRFPEGHVSHDMDIPAGSIPIRFGSSFTVYRADQQMVSLHQTRATYYFLMLSSGIIIASGVVSVLLLLFLGRTKTRVHPYVISPMPMATDYQDPPGTVYYRQPVTDMRVSDQLVRAMPVSDQLVTDQPVMGDVIRRGSLVDRLQRTDEPIPNLHPEWSEVRLPGAVNEPVPHIPHTCNRERLAFAR